MSLLIRLDPARPLRRGLVRFRYTLHGTEALTDNYLKLRLRGQHGSNRWVRAMITQVADGVLLGRPQDAELF